MKAVEHSTTVIGMLCEDGVVLAAERQVQSKLYENDSLSSRRIYHIDSHIGCAVAGLLTDARSLIDVARAEATNYREQWNKPIPVEVLVKRFCRYMFQHTLNGYYRPFGCAVIVGGTDPDTGSWDLKKLRFKKNEKKWKKNVNFYEKIKIDPKSWFYYLFVTICFHWQTRALDGGSIRRLLAI